MDNHKKTPEHHKTYDETKIYTPRYASQMRADVHPCVMLDHAPVRIYKRPIKNITDSSERSDVIF